MTRTLPALALLAVSLSGCASGSSIDDSFSDSDFSYSDSSDSFSQETAGSDNALAAAGDEDNAERRRRPARVAGSPFASYTLYVDADNNAADQADAWRYSRSDDADLMDVLAAQPLAEWIGDWTWDVTGTVDDIITDGGSQLRTLVVYNIPYRDCGYWSAGGAADVAAYGGFITDIAAGIAGRKVMVVLEPDALALQTCLTADQQVERMGLLSAAVTTLTAAGASVYIDAGDSNWIGATDMADLLEDANVAGAAGFSLNVSHTEYSANEIGFAEELRAILGTTAHYVVDTGRAGLGPTADNQWCNPLERAIGERPTTVTTTTGLDAFLWIKPPGESDGSCNGGPPAGDWWDEYALELADLGTP